ncbi:HNH endonuclease [Mycolicibacterium conceptionense]|uniref:HNH endonuclease n=1 Tax=Mycolicibacterium conceptionense TaxID=451644 RepID=UPI0007EB0983|nr:HNH endonuclease [Mycolicibacterium conceptionense]
MTWTGSGKGSQIPQALRRKVFARANNECEIKYPGICTGKAEHVDHIVNLASQGLPRGVNDLDGLQAACVPCHRSKTGREGRAAQLKAKESIKRKFVNPGLAGGTDVELPESPWITRERERAEQRQQDWAAKALAESEELRRLAEEWVREQDG